MNRIILITIFLFFNNSFIFSQKNYNIHVGLDISPIKNIAGQHEFLIEYNSQDNRWINPFFRVGFANRSVSSGGCLKDDNTDNKKAQGWFLKLGNDFNVFKKWAISPLIIYNNYQSSATFNDGSKKQIEIKGQKTFYAGLGIKYDIFNKTKWGLSMRYSGVRALQKEQFLGASCNEIKIGAGLQILPNVLYMSLQTLVFYKF